jgi:hypothetical protein
MGADHPEVSAHVYGPDYFSPSLSMEATKDSDTSPGLSSHVALNAPDVRFMFKCLSTATPIQSHGAMAHPCQQASSIQLKDAGSKEYGRSSSNQSMGIWGYI